MERKLGSRQKESKKCRLLDAICICSVLAILILTCANIIIAKNTIALQEEQTIEAGTVENVDFVIYTEIFGRKFDVTDLFERTDTLDCKTVGDYEIEFIFNFFGIKKITTTVHVVDTLKPLIMLIESKDIVINDIKDYVEQGFFAHDIVDGDLTERVEKNIYKKEANRYAIQYKVKDNSGNETIAEKEITVISGEICLTFDDGPSENITPQILDLLKEKNIKATFFVVGFDDTKNGIIQRIAEEGHTLAIHGMSHEYSTIYSSLQTLMNNFDVLENKIYTITGNHSTFIRFPGGSSNTVSRNYSAGIMSEAVEKVAEKGYVYFDWNVDSNDAGGAKTSDEIYNNIVSGLKKGRTNVVLMHDSAGHQITFDALEKVIEYGLENDYVFKSITTETPQVKHNVAN